MVATAIRPTPARGPMGLSSESAPALDLPARFLVLGAVTLALLAVTAPWTASVLTGGFYDPRLLAFVHANTLGLVGAIILARQEDGE